MDVKSHDLIHLNCIQFISTLIYIHKLKGSWHCMWGKGAPIFYSHLSCYGGRDRKRKYDGCTLTGWNDWLIILKWCISLSIPSTIFVYEKRSGSFSSVILVLWSDSIAFIQNVGLIWRGREKEGWGLALALKKLSIGFGTWGGKEPLTWTTGITLPDSTQKTLVLFTGRGICEPGGPESASGKRGLR